MFPIPTRCELPECKSSLDIMILISPDKVLVSIVPGITNGFSEAVSSLEETVSSMPHLMEVVVSSYRAVNEGSFTASRFTGLSEV